MSTHADAPAAPSDRVAPPAATRSRPRTFLRFTGVVLGVAALGLAVLYHRQLWSYATHLKGGPDEIWTVEPLATEGLRLRLAAVGDVGDGSDDIYVTAASMYEQGRSRPYDLLLLLGDNVYPFGDPDKLDRRVFRPLRSVIDQGTELRAILGNHDVMSGRGDEQIARLGMPGRYHAIERSGVLVVGLDTELDDDREQLAWLEETLADSEADFKIVAMHRSPYSAGYQGSFEQAREEYVPLFRRFGVQLVLSGHDHDYQRSVALDGTTYVVSGAGAEVRRTGAASWTAASYAVHHFVDIAVYEDHLRLRAVQDFGGVFDEAVIHLDGRSETVPPPG